MRTKLDSEIYMETLDPPVSDIAETLDDYFDVSGHTVLEYRHNGKKRVQIPVQESLHSIMYANDELVAI